MPTKQQSKADLAKKQKIVEDKTFGLENKNKSKNVQKYVQSLQQTVQPKPDPSKIAAKKKEEEEKAGEKELNDLFKIAISQPKVPVATMWIGYLFWICVDPKPIVCKFYKVGQCAKGLKCEFSHYLNVQRKGKKIDLYSDKRDQELMEDWDQETLEKVVESKKKEYNQNKPTEIVCKYFLEPVEKKQYGGSGHALPQGYVLKSQMKVLIAEEAEKMPIEDEIEDQRSKLTKLTPMTPELFMEWKNKRTEQREAGFAAQRVERAKNDRISGCELFLSDASLFVDDAEAYEKHRREEEPEAVKEISVQGGASSSTEGAAAHPEEPLPEDNDDDELDMDELNELEASLSRTFIEIREPGTKS